MTAQDVIRGYKDIAEELRRVAGWSPCERTLMRYAQRPQHHNPLPLYVEIGREVAIVREELHAWVERERAVSGRVVRPAQCH